MATKINTEETVVTEEQAVVPAATKPKTARTAVKEESGQYVYVGPSKMRTKLVNGKVLVGTKSEVLSYFAREIESYPAVSSLIVPAAETAGARKRISEGGNLMSKYYAEVQSAEKEN